MACALLAGLTLAWRSPSSAAWADDHQMYYCEESTHVTVGSRTVSTPVVCVPFP